MNIKSPQTLISEALKEIKTISAKEALKLSGDNQCNLVDLREEGEIKNTGSIENSFHVPRTTCY